MADTPILSNPLKEMMKAGKVALGMNVRLARSGDIARIAKRDGVDVSHIGANDRLTAMGKPGAFSDPEGAKVIDRVISVAAANGKIPGMGGDRNIPRQREYIRKGARFITTNSEIAFILAEGTRVTTELRRALP